MTQYLDIIEAKAVIDAATGANDVYHPRVHGELWAVANLPVRAVAQASSYTDIGIERIDCPEDFDIDAPSFEWDDDAKTHVEERAAQGSQMHADALRIHHAADSIRFHLWGEEWIDSRIGPEKQAA